LGELGVCPPVERLEWLRYFAEEPRRQNVAQRSPIE
jgi:hypothetical protein